MRAILDRGYAAQAWREHDAILAAILAGEADRAEELARLHAWQAADMLCGSLSRRGSEKDRDAPDMMALPAKEFAG